MGNREKITTQMSTKKKSCFEKATRIIRMITNLSMFYQIAKAATIITYN